jgi:hypothetical protein
MTNEKGRERGLDCSGGWSSPVASFRQVGALSGHWGVYRQNPGTDASLFGGKGAWGDCNLGF